jgi:hypothetical protein
MFINGIPFNQPAHNEFYQMILVGGKIDIMEDQASNQYIDIRHLFPRYILFRSESSSPTNYLVKFTQAYYDWLYNFGGYRLFSLPLHSIAISELLDIDHTPDDFLKHFIYTYAPGFPDWYLDNGNAAGAPPDPHDTSQFPDQMPDKEPRRYEGVDAEGGIRTFIKNIRQAFYQRKSTEDAYRYFFQSLYGADQDAEFYYPKTDIFRLNGGRFNGQHVYGHITGMPDSEARPFNWLTDEEVETPWRPNYYDVLPSSTLNGRWRFQDSYWFQEYSYVVKGHIPFTDSETGLPIYFDALHEMLHPAGMKGFWEKTEDDYIPPDDFDGGFNFCESPKLENYFGYRMDDTDWDSPGKCMGCSGSGHTYDGPTAMFYGYSESSLGGMTGWTFGSGWDTIGKGGIFIPGAGIRPGGSTYASWGGGSADIPRDSETGDWPAGSTYSQIYGAATHFYPHWALGICGDIQHSTPFKRIYIGEFIRLCPLENSPNLGLTGCTANSC